MEHKKFRGTSNCTNRGHAREWVNSPDPVCSFHFPSIGTNGSLTGFRNRTPWCPWPPPNTKHETKSEIGERKMCSTLKAERIGIHLNLAWFLRFHPHPFSSASILQMLSPTLDWDPRIAGGCEMRERNPRESEEGNVKRNQESARENCAAPWTYGDSSHLALVISALPHPLLPPCFNPADPSSNSRLDLEIAGGCEWERNLERDTRVSRWRGTHRAKNSDEIWRSAHGWNARG